MANDHSKPQLRERDGWYGAELTGPFILRHPVVTAVAMTAHAVAMLPRHVMAPDASVRLQTLAEITAEEVTGAGAPDLVVSPLLARGFDATDLLTTLREAEFKGRFLVLAPRMPDIPLIRAEMLVQAPGVNVDIIALSGASVLHLL